MENAVKKVQTETMYEVTFEGETYTVMHSEDANHESGYFSWEVSDDDGNYLEDHELESAIIEFTIENM